MRNKVRIGTLLGVLLASRGAWATFYPDIPVYGGGRVISPHFVCMMWSPAGDGGFAPDDEANIEAYMRGLQDYFNNYAAPANGSAAGTEPTPRQYGVWGASFSGSCFQDHTDPMMNLSFVGGSAGQGRITQEIWNQQQAGQIEPYAAMNIFVVFTKGWTLDQGQPDCIMKWSNGWSGGGWGYSVTAAQEACPYTDIRNSVSRGIIDLATNPNTNGWQNVYNPEPGASCDLLGVPAAGEQVADDGLPTQIAFPGGVPDGYQEVWSSDDDLDALAGDIGNCGSQPGGTLFTNVTTTPPAIAVHTRDRLNYLHVIARTPTGLVHLMSTDNGVSYTTVSPAPGGYVTDLPTVFSPDGRSLTMFGRGTDGALYEWTYNGSAWAGPTWMGGYMIGPPSAAFASINGTKTTAVFARATNGSLAVNANGNWAYVAMPPRSMPDPLSPPSFLAISPPQVFARSSTCLDLYFTGDDGQTYLDACWTGNWQALPGGWGPLTAMNRVGVAGRVDVFSRQPTQPYGSLPYWIELNNGHVTSRAALSSLPKSVGQIAAVEVGSPSLVKLFYTRGNTIYGTTSDSTATRYTNWGQLDTVAVTSPPAAQSPDGTSFVVLARRQYDGHLIQWRWDGTSWTGATDLGVSIM
jgi:hypothetical protein